MHPLWAGPTGSGTSLLGLLASLGILPLYHPGRRPPWPPLPPKTCPALALPPKQALTNHQIWPSSLLSNSFARHHGNINNNNKEPNTAPAANLWYPLTLGSSFSNNSSSKFCTLRYEFKPASIDKSQPGSFHKNKDNRITVDFQNNQPGKPKVTFDGTLSLPGIELSSAARSTTPG